VWCRLPPTPRPPPHAVPTVKRGSHYPCLTVAAPARSLCFIAALAAGAFTDGMLSAPPAVQGLFVALPMSEPYISATVVRGPAAAAVASAADGAGGRSSVSSGCDGEISSRGCTHGAAERMAPSSDGGGCTAAVAPPSRPPEAAAEGAPPARPSSSFNLRRRRAGATRFF